MNGQTQKSKVLKRSIVIAGHKTSISVEDEFWDALGEIATRRGVTMSALVSKIDSDRQHNNLSSTIRLFVLNHYRALAERRADQPNAT